MMKRFLGFIVLIILLNGGCGNTSGTEETGVRLDITTAAINDAGKESKEIDVLRNLDCNNDGNNDDPETYTDALLNISIKSTSISPLASNDQLPTMYVRRYTVEFIPQLTSDGKGNSFYPPDLNPLSFDTYIAIPPNSEITASLFLVPILTKDEYVTKAATMPSIFGSYSIKVTLYGESEFGEDFSLTIDVEAHFGNWDNC